MHKDRHTSLLAVSLFLIKDGKILLGRRQNTFHGNGQYGLISGHIDGNEPARVAMARETKEECGLAINPEDLQTVHVQHLKLPPEYVNFFFTVDTWNGEPKIMEPHKCDDMRWFDLKALPENMSENIKYAIAQWQAGKFYSEFGWNN